MTATQPVLTHRHDNTPAEDLPRSRHQYDHLAPLFSRMTDPKLSASRRRQLRDQLILGHLPVAEHIAHRFRGRGQPENDLRQVAALGLVNAVDRFDPHRGTDFLSFAVPTINGEVRRHFRDAGWTIRVPRWLQETHIAVQRATGELATRFGRAARPSELANHLDLPVETVRAALAAGNAYQPDSLNQPTTTQDAGTTTQADQLGGDDAQLDTVDNRETLHPALAALPERERTIVLLRFYGNMTQTQIAERVHISQMHVSRLLATSLAMLREHLTAPPPNEDGNAEETAVRQGHRPDRT